MSASYLSSSPTLVFPSPLSCLGGKREILIMDFDTLMHIIYPVLRNFLLENSQPTIAVSLTGDKPVIHTPLC